MLAYQKDPRRFIRDEGREVKRGHTVLDFPSGYGRKGRVLLAATELEGFQLSCRGTELQCIEFSNARPASCDVVYGEFIPNQYYIGAATSDEPVHEPVRAYLDEVEEMMELGGLKLAYVDHQAFRWAKLRRFGVVARLEDKSMGSTHQRRGKLPRYAVVGVLVFDSGVAFSNFKDEAGFGSFNGFVEIRKKSTFDSLLNRAGLFSFSSAKTIPIAEISDWEDYIDVDEILREVSSVP